MDTTEEAAAAVKKVELQHVLGVTVSSNSALDTDQQTGTVAYPAGCVVVLYNTRKNKQRHLVSEAKKNITALSYSSDGKYLVTGECGAVCHVRVWDVQKLTQVADLPGHKHGINCVAFSPNGKYVVSVGSQHDLVVNVWDWRSNQKVASNKVSCKVKALSFAAGGNYFVTVGNNHVKFWYLEYARSTKHRLEPVPLMGRSAILGDQRSNYFCDVGCGRGEAADSTFAVTKSGLLCEFNGRRLLDKWVELRIPVAHSISVGETLIAVGCCDGIVRCFSPLDLHFVCTLPRPHYLGVDVAKGLTGRQMSSHPPGSKYPDVIAVSLDEAGKRVSCVHSDHSVYVWDVRDPKKVGKSHSALYHSACIWGVETGQDNDPLPGGTFFTCASDDTIRVWNLEHKAFGADATLKRNVYCHELLKILYTDPNLVFLCDIDFLPAETNEKLVNTYDGRNGVRCLKIRPDGQHLASGDRSGNVRVYDLKYLELLCKIEAHDAEVLCLEYSDTDKGSPPQVLCSGSRDRLAHLFDASTGDYPFVQTLDEHTSSVTSVKFVREGEGSLRLVSCSADKSLVIRRVAAATPVTSGKGVCVSPDRILSDQTTFYDLEKDPARPQVLAACQDSRVRVYDVPTGKHVRSLQGGGGTLIKVALDCTGSYVATSSTDKTISVHDFRTGQIVATMSGHSELVTGLKFMPSGKHLVSVSGDGCIFVWKLTFQSPQAAKVERSVPLPISSGIWQDSSRGFKPLNDGKGLLDFSDGALPSWAKKQLSEEGVEEVESSPAGPQHPRGRWAQRLEGQALVVKSYSYTDSVIPIPPITGSLSITCNTWLALSSRYLLDEQKIAGSSLTEKDSKDEVKQKGERQRHPTDSSSASSQRLDDGDAEDERSDNSATPLVYYPEADFKNSSFQINATREEKRFAKSKQAGLQRSISTSFCSADKSSDHTDEDGDSSEAAPHPPSSMSFSTENLERVGRREQLVMRSFMGGGEEQHAPGSRHSLSSKHHTTADPLLQGRSNTLGRKSNLMSSKKREELTKALNDARKKLETLGYKSAGLSSSKSVGDLSNAEAEIVEKPKLAAKDSVIDMRRSTSFGDIRSGNFPRRRLPYTPQPGGQSAPLWEQAKTIRFEEPPKDPPKSPLGLKGSKLSSSATSLHVMPLRNQQPDQPPPQLHKSSSSAAINSGGRRLSLGGVLGRSSRGGPAYSDSSSSEAPSPTERTAGGQLVPRGIVARRMKAFCSSQEPHKPQTRKNNEASKSKSEWDLRKLGHTDSEDVKNKDKVSPEKDPQQTRAEYIQQLEASPNDLPVKDGTPPVAGNYLDLSATPLTKELCEKVSDDLKKVTSFAVQLFQRVTVDSQLSTSEKAAMTTTLAQGVWQAQQNLQPHAFTAATPPGSVPQDPALLLQQYSDKLLTLIEQRITGK
ncbi:hypothetical protein JTE90_014946 [Oedothorax gibbosus]|uniref:MABP1/WDR62 second WD40 domain-containing protein n=1 Tax=Oedothorax gibbosus TaxID=931172 RepID=A0AAV6UX32_9ARAC|nr:hypothetical protein JTE90_014946 [Oedothorax gibbosus]